MNKEEILEKIEMLELQLICGTEKYSVKQILDKYKNKASTINMYYEPMEKIYKSLNGIPSFRIKYYIVIINSNFNKEIKDDIKFIAEEYKVNTKEINSLPENVLAIIINKEKLLDTNNKKLEEW